MTRIIVGAILVTVFATGCLMVTFPRAHHWSGDGFWYAQTMLMDLGYSPDDAHRAAQAFYLRQPVARPPRSRWYFADDAPSYIAWKRGIFRGRPLYPFLASLLFHRYGFTALPIVSGAALVATTVALYLLLIGLAPFWLAALGASLLPLIGTVRLLGTKDVTDMLAAFLWVAFLAAAIGYMRNGRITVLWAAVLASIALALTRPALYLVVGAVAGVGVWAFLARDRAWRIRALTLLAWVGVVAACDLMLSAATATPGLADHMRYDYTKYYLATGQRPPFASWYLHAVANTLVALGKYHLFTHHALPALAVAALGISVGRRDPAAAAMIGSIAATLAVPFINPVPYDLSRTFDLPLYPLIVIGIMLGTTALLSSIHPRLQLGRERLSTWLRRGARRDTSSAAHRLLLERHQPRQ